MNFFVSQFSLSVFFFSPSKKKKTQPQPRDFNNKKLRKRKPAAPGARASTAPGSQTTASEGASSTRRPWTKKSPRSIWKKREGKKKKGKKKEKMKEQKKKARFWCRRCSSGRGSWSE